MTDDAVDAQIALAATTSKLAGRVSSIDYAATQEARHQLAVLLHELANAMWRGADYESLFALLSTCHPDGVDLSPQPIPDDPTPLERPSAFPRK